jgi:hypothetical protein
MYNLALTQAYRDDPFPCSVKCVIARPDPKLLYRVPESRKEEITLDKQSRGVLNWFSTY